MHVYGVCKWNMVKSMSMVVSIAYCTKRGLCDKGPAYMLCHIKKLKSSKTYLIVYSLHVSSF